MEITNQTSHLTDINILKMEDFINIEINDKSKFSKNLLGTPISYLYKKENDIMFNISPKYTITPINLNRIKTIEINDLYDKPFTGSINNLDNIFTNKKNKESLFNKSPLSINSNYPETDIKNFNMEKKHIFYLNNFNRIDNEKFKDSNYEEIQNDIKSTKNEIKSTGCNCENSNCLKMYCECLKKGGFCAAECRCLNCKNNTKNIDSRSKAIDKIKKKNPNVFKPRFDKISNFLKNGLYNNKEAEKVIHTQGCNCKKGCNKKYCECFGFGTFCTKLCKCDNCINISLKKNEEVKKKLFN